MTKAIVSVSKFLSLVLRHKPQTIGLTLAEDGWVSIAELLDAAKSNGKHINHDLLLRVVRENNKQRFAISDDGLRIRANQGHSIAVDLGLESLLPPTQLYHGTVDRFLDSIRATGLNRGNRQHVHLSSDKATAENVGSRRGQAVILTVAAGQMSAAGISFYRSENGVWLTHAVPPEYIAFPDE